MVSSSPSSDSLLYDEVRKCWVPATPEERVRQQLLQKMLYELGFPRELLVVEKELKQLPHISKKQDIPDRRIDILSFGKNIHPEHPLFPLLLIECKQGEIEEGAREQLLGYNRFVQAPFFALVNAHKIEFGYFDAAKDGYAYLSYIPPYRDLLK